MNNRKFYEDVLDRKKGDRDADVVDSEAKDDPSAALKNSRPNNDYKSSHEFVTYERLCRGEKTHVSSRHTILYLCKYIGVGCNVAMSTQDLQWELSDFDNLS